MRRPLPSLFAIAFACLCSFQGMATESDDAIVIGNLETVMTTRVYGHISVNAAGHVVHYEIRTSLTPDLKTLVDTTVQAWKFRPLLSGGKPIASEADVQITLVGRHDGDDLLVKVDNANFSTKPRDDDPVTITSRGRLHMGYPRALLRAEVQASVVVFLQLTPQGEVKDAFPAQVSLLDVSGAPDTLEAAARLAAMSAVAQARHFRFNVVFRGGNPPAEDPRLAVPIFFAMDDRAEARPGQWRTETRSRKQWPSWVPIKDRDHGSRSSDAQTSAWSRLGDINGLELATAVDGSAL